MIYQLINHPKLEMLVISDVHTNPKNSRKHSEKQIEALISSIRRFGFRGAILIDQNGVIVAGNALFEAARREGYTEVPVIRTHFLSDAERRAFIVAHNRLAELATWDEDGLNAELEFLFDQELGLEGTGFELKDLDFSLDKHSEVSETVELPDPLEPAISRLGDLWHIGPHRLYCGNARNPASFESVLLGELATLIFGDLPFNVSIQKHARGNGKVKPREFEMASGEMSVPEFTAFLRAIFRNCARFSTDGSIHYHCMDFRHLREILDAADGVYTEFKQLVVWAKPSGGQGAFMRSRHELVLVFKSGRGRHINNIVWSPAPAPRSRSANRDPAGRPTSQGRAVGRRVLCRGVCLSRSLGPFRGRRPVKRAVWRLLDKGPSKSDSVRLARDPVEIAVHLLAVAGLSGVDGGHARRSRLVTPQIIRAFGRGAVAVDVARRCDRPPKGWTELVAVVDAEERRGRRSRYQQTESRAR